MLDYNIVVISLTVLLANASYGLSAPILPQLLEDRGVAASWTGFIWASFSVAVIFVSLIAGSIVDCVGHSRLMSIGATIMALAIAAYSSAIYIDETTENSKYVFLGLAIFLSAVTGKQILLLSLAI